MTEDINAEGHEMWIPIPLDAKPEAFYELLMERFSGQGVVANPFFSAHSVN